MDQFKQTTGDQAAAKKHEATNDAGKAMGATGDAMKGYGQAAKENVQEYGQAAKDNVKQTTENAKDKTGDHMQNAGQKIKGEDKQPTVMEQVKNAASTAAQKTSEMVGSVTQTITGSGGTGTGGTTGTHK